MENYIFELKMKVRDYECDGQGIVNNANYQHYTEHTRHEFIESRGVKFANLHEQGIDPVVARISLTYKIPLRGGINHSLEKSRFFSALFSFFGGILSKQKDKNTN